MPNPGSDRPLRKVTLNLYDEDVTYLQHAFGWGYSDLVRQIIHKRVMELKSRAGHSIGDLE